MTLNPNPILDQEWPGGQTSGHVGAADWYMGNRTCQSEQVLSRHASRVLELSRVQQLRPSVMQWHAMNGQQASMPH